MVVDRFQKERHGNSTLYPEDNDILECVMWFYDIPRGGPHELYSLCSADNLELVYHVRERRNRLSSLIRSGYSDWVNSNNKDTTVTLNVNSKYIQRLFNMIYLIGYKQYFFH